MPITATALALATPVWAKFQPVVNNGTNPTSLASSACVQCKYSDLGWGFSNDVFEANFSGPFGPGRNKALSYTAPYASGPTSNSFLLGDLSSTFTHLLDVDASRGYAYMAKLKLDTSDRPDLGAGQTVLEFSGFYAKFLKDGSMVAPALIHRAGVADEDPGRSKVNTTTFDFHYAPKISPESMFVAFDPALISDWERDKGFASLTTTFGVPMGKAFDGDSQIFIKPQILITADRPADLSPQVRLSGDWILTAPP